MRDKVKKRLTNLYVFPGTLEICRALGTMSHVKHLNYRFILRSIVLFSCVFCVYDDWCLVSSVFLAL